MCSIISSARGNNVNDMPLHMQNLRLSDNKNVEWWGYFDGNYDATLRQGIDNDIEFPLTYDVAVRINADNPDVLGKKIKGLRFAIPSLKCIEDVKIWMSSDFPVKVEKADVCCQQVNLSELGGIDTDNVINEIAFNEPYLFGRTDLYVGYSFTLTSDEEELNTYPIIVSEGNTVKDAFYLNWGKGWYDLSGSENGNLALMLLLDDNVSFLKGDVNYDSDVNVGDISSTIKYILGGKLKTFNKEMADVDDSGEINIVDVASISDIILGSYVAGAEESYEWSDEELYTCVEDGTMDVSLMTEGCYKAFQMDIVVPCGEKITSVEACGTLRATHSISYSEISDGRYRIIVYSPSGSEINNIGESLLTVKATTDDINAENIIFATSDLKERHFQATSRQDAAAIYQVTNNNPCNAVYTIGGIKVNPSLQKAVRGIYIVNDKKVIVR